ncbi:hypothetical protein DMUE_3307 [Dictyocoela muelleri]|nr:hypothetical protein DMUE_3307 [Dictyocoela muelleri]
MVRNSAKEIVKPEKPFTDEDFDSLTISETFLCKNMSSGHDSNIFLASSGIIVNTMLCPLCGDGTRMSYVKRKPSPDSFYWVCKKTCRFSCSVRKNSLFEGTKLQMKTIFLIMYKYIKRSSFQDISYELQIDRGTVSEYAYLVREAICDYMVTTSDKIGGYNADGSSKIVEIDESLFFKRKYNRGPLTDGQWYVVGSKEV